MLRFALLASLCLVATGCVAPSSVQTASAPAVAKVIAGTVVIAPGAPLSWNGSGLKPDASSSNGQACTPVGCLVGSSSGLACRPSNCAAMPFTVEGSPARVALAVQPANEEGFFTARIADASGKVVQLATPGEYAEVAVAEALAPGAYVAQVLVLGGSDGYLASLHVEDAPVAASSPARDLLPDLVTLTPRDLRVATPNADFAMVAGAVGSKGCGPYEFVESAARRCLRFSNAVGNVGEGPLEVRLVGLDEATGMAGQAHFTQNIHKSDGTNRTQGVGQATFHPTHQHYHYAGLAHYDVYHYDVASKTRGAKLNEGRKSGFCFLDSAIKDLSKPIVSPYYYDHANCFQFVYSAVFGGGVQDEVMGVSPGWFDYYNWFLDDQVVEISSAKDGTYELVSCANSEKTLVESNLDNDCASVVFDLKGDVVTTLGVPQ